VLQLSKRVVATVQILEDGTALASVRGAFPFTLPPLTSIDIQEAVRKEQRAVTRRLDYKRYHRERAIASAFEASYTIQEN
jgi:hypothetical protein